MRIHDAEHFHGLFGCYFKNKLLFALSVPDSNELTLLNRVNVELTKVFILLEVAQRNPQLSFLQWTAPCETSG